MLLEGRTVCVTGASAGIGRAVAIGCARHGADVAINFAHDSEGANSAIAEIQALGRKAVAIRGDVAEPETAKSFIAGAVDALGRVDVFVNNAGICPFHAFLDMPVETFERTMRVNMHGAYFMVQAAASQMVKQGHGGAVIAGGSISAPGGGGYQTPYTPTQARLHSLMQSTAIPLRPHALL